MIKTQIIGSGSYREFQEILNAFIKDKAIVDIKYQAIALQTKVYDRALVIYREESKCQK